MLEMMEAFSTILNIIIIVNYLWEWIEVHLIEINIAKIMDERKLSYRELELLTEINKTMLHRIANNKRSPQLDQLEKIAQKLNLRIDDLYESEFK